MSCAKERTEKTIFKSVGANLKTVGFSLRTLYLLQQQWKSQLAALRLKQT
jgi:hypothetical protein